jgi:ParB-like chromosome segregation protein Spo0J
MKIRQQELKTVAIESLKPHPQNTRKSNMHVIKESIAHNGFYGAVSVQASTSRIIAGEHRWRAAKQQGAKEIPALFIDCDDEEAKRILIADNRSSDLGDHDERRLESLLEELAATREGLLGTGFGPSALSAEGESAARSPVTVKSWDSRALRLNAIFSFSAPIEWQHKIRAVLKEHFPDLDFLEHVTRFDEEDLEATHPQ